MCDVLDLLPVTGFLPQCFNDEKRQRDNLNSNLTVKNVSIRILSSATLPVLSGSHDIITNLIGTYQGVQSCGARVAAGRLLLQTTLKFTVGRMR